MNEKIQIFTAEKGQQNPIIFGDPLTEFMKHDLNLPQEEMLEKMKEILEKEFVGVDEIPTFSYNQEINVISIDIKCYEQKHDCSLHNPIEDICIITKQKCNFEEFECRYKCMLYRLFLDAAKSIYRKGE